MAESGPVNEQIPEPKPVQCFENNPIYFNDPDGKDAEITITKNTITAKIYIVGKIATQDDIMTKAKWGEKTLASKMAIKH